MELPVNDEFYMSLALDMAERAQGQTGINPVVGCVIVKDGALVGLGTHLKRGTAHAEVHAVRMAGEQAEGGTVYVTLEPCSHHGKTPPCSDLLIEAKVKRVVVACLDPNPVVAGSGIKRLRQHGIEVHVGTLRERAVRLNDKFAKYITTQMPYVTIKAASTLDGKIATETGDSKWISNEEARLQAHALRHRHQAIMVGIGTALADDPSLTTRHEGVDGLQPVRIVVDSRLRLTPEANLLKVGTSPIVILTTEQAPVERRRLLEELGAEILVCGAGPRVDLEAALEELGRKEIGSVLVEGGGALNGELLRARLVDRIVLYFAPKIVGGKHAPHSFDFEGIGRMADAITLDDLEVDRVGDNIFVSGKPIWPDHVNGEEQEEEG
ncbi:bifunctional diaminohydroxyphosphoribosylaminopyrimidine deaminase/5-amino-6-(5-phosphoribosylamino)uracil reductase RibD [Paenibacillus sp. VCA1]|uniref:bifunctional diaminohydroxyphosphoribosylaminopyrimidine deaminase/5-amino-6-(5-phosphoribosylamino)uracil reductase RibD n=1 Tax=Paenibacillus sp. VCA1 TaxID=3039148 RepID=UPI0028719F45|nr:bifunctional diaminohydroxyphosphoribosylaminopyrimidine deaminase/5-amino-6-(5-phosphoribosylamino)uracil reductase RibD [Paenibacillus sp. VCA1]MDR9853765.1 bifunctional diaminohydroxyphosphoribosylaminopyrimidine deaminase/5-amino-6-(5-phosphoribosylamino)uracil reductase RibD [Paenibacillus sp. VCA1]